MRQADLIVVKWRPQSVQDLISLGESQKRCSGKNKKNIFWRIMLSVAFFKNIVIWRFIFWQMNATVHVSQAYNHKVQHFNSKLYYYHIMEIVFNANQLHSMKMELYIFMRHDISLYYTDSSTNTKCGKKATGSNSVIWAHDRGQA